jgi:hypothetical protein
MAVTRKNVAASHRWLPLNNILKPPMTQQSVDSSEA